MFKLKFSITLFIVLCFQAFIFAQSDCVKECQKSEAYVLAENQYQHALNNPYPKGFNVDYYHLNLLLRQFECRTLCDEFEWTEQNCKLTYGKFYKLFVKKWEFTSNYDSLCYLLNFFMNNIFGCNLPSPC